MIPLSRPCFVNASTDGRGAACPCGRLQKTLPIPHWGGGGPRAGWRHCLRNTFRPTGSKNLAVAGAKVTPKHILDATTVRGPTRAASAAGGDGRVPRGATQMLAFLMRCPEARANVSRRTTRLFTNYGCREYREQDLRIVGMVLADVPLIGHQDAQLWALPKPAGQCLRHKKVEERRHGAALTDTSLPGLGLGHMTVNDVVSASVAQQQLNPPHHGPSAPSSHYGSKQEGPDSTVSLALAMSKITAPPGSCSAVMGGAALP
jgi:hypothetical protein